MPPAAETLAKPAARRFGAGIPGLAVALGLAACRGAEPGVGAGADAEAGQARDRGARSGADPGAEPAPERTSETGDSPHGNGPHGSGAAGAASVSPPKAGGRVVVGLRRLPTTLDPVGELDAWGQRVVDDLLHAGLTRRVTDAPWAVPALAERCLPQADGRTIACRLRPDARFHDDAPVTADDVVHSVNLWLGNHSAPLRQRYGLDELRSVEVGPPPGESGGTWVRLGFGHAGPLVLERIAAIKVVPKKRRGEIGCGPLRLAERGEERLVFAPVAGDGPEVELRVIADGAAGITALRRGEIHVLAEVTPAHVPDELGKPGMATRFRGFLVSPAIYDVILYNLREGAQAGPRLRGALDLAIPRAELTSSVYGEPALATTVPVDLHAPSEIDLVALAEDRTAEAGLGLWTPPDPAADAAAIAAADRVLVELGWVLERGVRRRGTVNLRLPFSWDASPGLASQVARSVRGAWKQLGITAPNVTAGWAYVLTLLRAGKFSVALARIAGGSDTDLAPYFHSRGAHNLTGVHDPGLDAALEAYRRAGDRAARDAAKAAIAEKLAALRPVSVLHAPLQVLLISRAVTGLEFVDDLPRLDRLGLGEPVQAGSR